MIVINITGREYIILYRYFILPISSKLLMNTI